MYSPTPSLWISVQKFLLNAKSLRAVSRLYAALVQYETYSVIHYNSDSESRFALTESILTEREDPSRFCDLDQGLGDAYQEEPRVERIVPDEADTEVYLGKAAGDGLDDTHQVIERSIRIEPIRLTAKWVSEEATRRYVFGAKVLIN